jgi:type I restriction enzyme S subunit
MLDEAKSQWRVGQFGEIAKVKSGFAFKSQDFCDPSDDSVAVIRMSDLKQGRVTWETAKNVPATVVAGLERFQLSAGDFLFGMSGSLGNYGIVPSADRPIFLNQRVGKLEPIGSSGSFLAFLFTSERFLSEIERRASGNAQANISGKQIESIEVDIPPLPEQERIAEILTSVDDSIRATEAVIAQAERVKRGLMEDLLTGGLGSEAIARGEVPEGWRQDDLINLVTLKRGYDLPISQRVEGDYPVVASNGPVGMHNEPAVSGPVVVTGRSGTIGKVELYEQDCHPLNTTLYSQKLHGNDPRYVAEFLRFFRLERFATGTGVPTLNRNLVHAEKIVIPPVDEQERIAGMLLTLDEQVSKNHQTVEQLQTVKRGLMDDLFTGRVRTL